MYILDWALFIPAAFIASMFAGTAGTYIAEHLYSWQWLIWVVSGSFSAGVFLLVGIKVVPRVTGAVKWSLIGSYWESRLPPQSEVSWVTSQLELLPG